MTRDRAGGIAGRARRSLWIWPLVTVAVALVVGNAVTEIEVGDAPFLFRGDATAGRTVLTALVGGLVTALSVIFSLTIAGLQTVHAQYSPRLLQNFIQDSGAQVTLSTFAGVTAFMLAVVRRIPATPSSEPVPRLAITIGLVLFLVCVGVVAYYAQHITHSMRVTSAMERVMHDALGAAPVGDGDGDGDNTDVPLPAPPPDALVITAAESGYVQGADLEALATIAARHAVTIRLRPMVGDPVVAGTPLAWVWPAHRRDGELFHHHLDANVWLSSSRTLESDVTYGLRQLVDVAVRAMSPSLNDPYTAVQGIDHLTVMLCRLAGTGIGPHVLTADDGRVLVAQPGPDLLDCVRLACDQIRRFGAHEPAVAVRLLMLLRDVAQRTGGELRHELRHEAERVIEHAENALTEPDDLAGVHAEAATALSWIDGNLVPGAASSVRL